MPNTRSIKSTKEVYLKRYSDYIEKIEAFCKLIGVKVVRTHYPSDGAWVPARNKIVLDHDLSETEEIATFLHELGHCLDDTFMYKSKVNSRVYLAYSSIYTDKFTPKQLELVVEAEKVAWEFGRHIAKRLGIRLGKWYTDIAQDAIKSYKDLAR